MEKNGVKIIEKQFNVFSRFPVLSLLLIGIGAIIIRLIFFQNELIFNSDNLSYFKYSVDVYLSGQSSHVDYLKNNGWPLFVSIFYHVLESKNFLDYMNLQSYISIVLSTLTIIPLYFLAKKFTNSLFALISTIFFVFEPRIIHNSLQGITDPLFILLIVTSLALIVQKNKFIIYGACITIGLSCIVRVEGLFLIPTICTMFLIKNKITKKNILQCIIFIIIIYLVLLPFSMERIETTGNDNLTGRIFVEAQKLTVNNSNTLESKIIGSISLFIQFFVKLMIPYLWLFVPIGIILFLKEKEIKKSLLIIPGFFLILPSFYAYTIPALDSRYLFPILPIICIIGVYSCKKYFQNNKYKKMILVAIIIIVIFSSILFLVYKGYGNEDQREFLELADIINKNTDIILYNYTPIFSYLEPAKLLELKEFPVMSPDYDAGNSTRIIFESYSNIEELFTLMEKNGITHIVYDKEINNPIIIKELIENNKENKKLKKIFDSQKNGFNYKIEIFELKF